MFVTEFVPPGLAYEDEPSVAVPVGWHVRLGMTDEQRHSPEWEWHWWPSVHTGDGTIEHFHAVMIAKVANDRWDALGRVPDQAYVALRDAVAEMSGTAA